MQYMKSIKALAAWTVAVGLAIPSLAACTDDQDTPGVTIEGVDKSVLTMATDYADDQLDVSGTKIVAWRKGGECLVIEVAAPNDGTYRVVMVNQNPNPTNPYEPLGVWRAYTLDDFVGDSDGWCGIYKSDAWGKKPIGESAIVG